jgi:hypothetical protein
MHTKSIVIGDSLVRVPALRECIGELVECYFGRLTKAIELDWMDEGLGVEPPTERVDNPLSVFLHSAELVRILEMKSPLRPVPGT